ncbi:amidotransferase 1, exosortase A system-associated [soil metagenome]
MCGIVGSVTAAPAPAGGWVTAQLPALAHRGPDARGARSFAGGCELGHTRLRILDLSSAGDQPMSNEDGTVWTAFNGELYNFPELRAGLVRRGHTFRSSTDTEVLVHLYEEEGDRLVSALHGMFAFAVWDTRSEELLLCRDRLGIKPLYYRVDGAGLRFASEARVLAEASEALDVGSVHAYLRLGWVPGPQAIFAGVQELPPGHVLRWRRGRATLERYWSSRPGTTATVDDVELRETVSDAVNRHLVADVPAGIFLSAGVDSALIAHLAAEKGDAVSAYTVAFDDGEDESADAAALAQRFGLRHTVVPVPGSEVPDSLDRIIASMDQPTVDGVNSWVISQAVRAAGLTVALSGLGGDELFRGYSTFRHVPRLVAAGRLGARLPASVRDLVLRPVAATSRTRHSRGRRALEATLTGGRGLAYGSVRGLFSSGQLSELWPASADIAGPLVHQGPGDGDGTATVGQLELNNYLPYQLLRDTDAASMAHSLEVRVPLLDDAIVALVLKSPGLGKSDLVRAIDPSLAWLARRPKRTFTLPFASWMRGPLRPQVRDAMELLGESSLGFDRRGLADIMASFEAGRAGWRPVWALAVLALWMERRRVGARTVAVEG